MQVIGDIFAEIQESGSINNKLIYSLIDEYVERPSDCMKGLEQCYLKICKLGQKTTKKPIEKFEKITEKFFQLFNQEANNPKSKKAKVDSDDVFGVLQHFLGFLSQGLDAPHLAVRQICAKHISIMLKVFADEELDQILDQKVMDHLNEGTMDLLRSKQPSLKLLGLKIASYIQKFESAEVEQEVVNIVTTEESRDIRKVAIINLRTGERTLSALLTRTRDVDSELRLLVYKKLIKDKVHLANLKLQDVYKVVYDGLCAREEGVREQCIAYLRDVYYMFNAPTHSQTEAEKKSTTKRVDDKEAYSQVKLALMRFLKLFQVQKTLIHPHLYDFLELVVAHMIKYIIEPDQLECYVKEFIRVDMKQQKLLNARPEEIFFLRVMCQHVTKHQSEFSGLSSLIDDLFPSLAELSKIIDKAYGKKDLVSTYQIILLSELLLNSDETGRQAIIATLRKILMNMEIQLELVDDEEQNGNEEYNDIYPKKSEIQLILEGFAQSFMDTPIVQKADDLVPVIVRILRKLLDDKNNAFSTFLLETISEIREPIERGHDTDRSELIEERNRLRKHIEHFDSLMKEAEEKIGQHQNRTRTKSQNPEVLALEQEYKKAKLEREGYVVKQRDIEDRISRINIRCLHVACTLLEGCKLSASDPGIMGLLGSFIGPCFQDENTRVKDRSFKCLSLYLLLDKRICTEYMKIYKALIDDHRLGAEATPSLLTAIKAIFDFLLMFKFGVEEDVTFESNNEDTFDGSDIINNLIAHTFHGDTLTKKVCIEGFCKLIFNNKVKNPTEMISLLMLIWINPQLTLGEGTEIIQTLSMFYKAYTPYAYSCLQNCEKALEIFIGLLTHISEDKEFEFNQKLFPYEISEENLNLILRAYLSLMRKDEQKFGDEENEGIPPLERLFVYLAQSSSHKDKCAKLCRKIFAKNLNLFEFENLPAFNKSLLSRFISELAEEKDGGPFKDFMKKLEISAEDKKTIDEEEILALDKELEEEISKSKMDLKLMIRSLKNYEVLTKRTKAKAPDTPEKEMDSEPAIKVALQKITENVGEEEETEEKQPKNDSEDEEENNNEEEEEEEEEKTEAQEEEENTKARKSPRKRQASAPKREKSPKKAPASKPKQAKSVGKRNTKDKEEASPDKTRQSPRKPKPSQSKEAEPEAPKGSRKRKQPPAITKEDEEDQGIRKPDKRVKKTASKKK